MKIAEKDKPLVYGVLASLGTFLFLLALAYVNSLMQ